MKKLYRKKLFFILILIFIIITPLLIAYSLGYDFNISKKEVRLTGGIFIKTRTPRVSIFLDNALVKETPLLIGGALLTRIEPGMHILQLKKKDYTPWTKTVEVKPSTVTELRNILLIPQSVSRATSAPEEIKNIEALKMEENISRILEATSSAGILFLDNKNNLLERKGTSTRKIARNIHSFALLKNLALWVDKNGFLVKYNISEDTQEILGHPGFFLSRKPMKFIKSPGGEIAILDESGGIFLTDLTTNVQAIDGGVREIYFDNSGEKALLVKEFEIKILWVRDNVYQPFQKRGTLESILSLSSPLNEARWLYLDNAHIVIRATTGLFLTELDGRGGRNTIELASDKTDELFTSPQIPNAVFFRKGKEWFRIEL
jgi:hypothetical protein